MLLTTLIVNLCLTALHSDASSLQRSFGSFSEKQHLPELNERFNRPSIIKPISKPVINYEKFGVTNNNNNNKAINKRQVYTQRSLNPSYQENAMKYNFGNEYSRQLFDNPADESKIKTSHFYENRFIHPTSEYSVLSMSSGLNHGTKLQPMNTKTKDVPTIIPEQKNKGILQIQQILSSKCSNFREEFIQCGCERTCININGECTYKPCEANCYCRNGWVRDTAENCVPSSYYCKNPLEYSNIRENTYEIYNVSPRENTLMQNIQLKQSSRLTPFQFNKPRTSLVCVLPQDSNYLQHTYIYSSEDFDKSGSSLLNSNHQEQKFRNVKNQIQPISNRDSNAPICSENEVAVDCICERKCDDPEGIRCQSNCERGCVCKNGFARIDRKCLRISACDLLLHHEEQKNIFQEDEPVPYSETSSTYETVRSNNFGNFNFETNFAQNQYPSVRYPYTELFNVNSTEMNVKMKR